MTVMTAPALGAPKRSTKKPKGPDRRPSVELCGKLDQHDVAELSLKGVMVAASCAEWRKDSVKAWTLYDQAARTADAKGVSDVSKAAHASLVKLDAKVGRVRVVAPDERGERTLERASIRLDDRNVNVGEEVAVDEGPHRVVAALGERSIASNFQIAAGSVRDVVLVLPGKEEPPPKAKVAVTSTTSAPMTAAAAAEEPSAEPPVPLAASIERDAPTPRASPRETRWTLASDLALAHTTERGAPGGDAILKLSASYAITRALSVTARESLAYARPVSESGSFVPANPIVGVSYAIPVSRWATLAPRLSVAIPVGGASGDGVADNVLRGRYYSSLIDPSFQTNYLGLMAGARGEGRFGQVTIGLSADARQLVRTRGAGVDSDAMRTQVVARLDVSAELSKVEPFVSIEYTNTVTRSSLITQDRGMQGLLFGAIGARVHVGDATVGLSYQPPLRGTPLSLELHVVSLLFAYRF